MQYIRIPGTGKVQGGMRLAGKASHSLSPGFILVLNIVPSVLVLYVKNQADAEPGSERREEWEETSVTVSENSRLQMVSGEKAALSRVLFLTWTDMRGRLILYSVSRDLHKLTSGKKKRCRAPLFWLYSGGSRHAHTCTIVLDNG